MLKDLLPGFCTAHTALRDYRVRYSLNSFLYMEIMHKPIDKLLEERPDNWEIDDILHLLRAGLCHLPENDKAVSDRAFEFVAPTIAQLSEAVAVTDLPLLRYELANAILEAFPKCSGSGENTQPDAHRDEHLRTLFVDIIGRSEEEFWRSSYDEIIRRSESWLEAKGLKEPVQQIQMYDDD